MSLKKINQIKKTEAYLVTDKININYLSNFTGSSGVLLLTKTKSYLLTDFRYEKVAKNQLPSKTELIITATPLEDLQTLLKKNNITTVYFEENDLTYRKYQKFKKSLKKIKFLPAESPTLVNRVQKTPAEIKLIIKAQRIAEKTFKDVRKKIKIGQTEKEIAWEIEKMGRENGADDVSFPPIVAFGNNSSSPHHQNSSKKLKKGDLILIDMGLKYKAYCSDMTRILFTAPPTSKQRKIYQIVLKAQKEAIKKLKPGITGEKADKVARDIIAEAGYEKEFGHSLGHGIGLQVHEAPYLSTRYPKPIPNNSVVTVEPGIYLQNSFGIRIEDMVLVKHNKVESITKIPTKIENLILSIR